MKNTSYLSVPYFSYDGLPEANGGSMKMITTVLHLEKTTDDNLAGEVDLLNEEQ